ncbi:MAG: S41 family peptidase [Alphaproteobacteria bacterium]
MNRIRTLAAVVAAFLAGSLFAYAAQESNSDTYRQLKLFGDIFERVRADYVEPVSDKDLIENAIKGMLGSLDPHSSYLDAKAYQEMQVQTRGEFGGLGIEVTMENGYIKVVSPIDDTPAFRAGLQPGDLITHLDGESVQGMTLAEAVDKMRGKVKTDIKLTIRRGNQPPFDVKLVRDVIRVQSVRARNEGNVGYIRITAFNEQTAPGLEAAIAKIKADIGKNLKGLVIDLRNNPGGLLDQAIAVSDAFLTKGAIVSTRGRRPDEATIFNARGNDLLSGLPIVVLINGGSASASEIVAGALQDHHRAIVMGTRSFGKGSVQTIIPIPGHGAVRLTTSRYYTPSGRSIQGKGIEPDIMVEQAKVEALDKGSERHEADLRGALKNTDQKPDQKGEGQPAPKGDTPSPGQGAGAPAEQQDYQLSRALDLLRGISLYKSSQTVN